MRNPFSMSRDDLLAGLGLQTRRSAAVYVVPAVSMFAIGLLAGAGLGLLFAPRSGNEIRRQIGTKVGDVTTRVKTKLQQMQHKNGGSSESLYGGSEYSGTDYASSTGTSSTGTSSTSTGNYSSGTNTDSLYGTGTGTGTGTGIGSTSGLSSGTSSGLGSDLDLDLGTGRRTGLSST